MLTLAALFVATSVAIFGWKAQAAVTDVPLKGGEKILISVPEAAVHLQAGSGKIMRIHLNEAASEDYSLQVQGGVIRIEPKDAPAKENFGRFAAKKRLIEIQGPSVPVEIHAFEGQIQLTKWSREGLLHVQKGRILVRESSGSLVAHAQTGDIQILDHQGRVEIDSYKASVAVRNLTGDAEIGNFSGETVLEKARGFLSLNQGQGSTKILGSSGTLQFDVTKGIFQIQNFQGRVEGQTQEGPVNVTLANDAEVNLRSQNGRVTLQAPANSGTLLNLATTDGDIQVPNYLRVNRDGGQKTLRGRLKGDAAKGSVVVRSQEGAIIVR